MIPYAPMQTPRFCSYVLRARRFMALTREAARRHACCCIEDFKSRHQHTGQTPLRHLYSIGLRQHRYSIAETRQAAGGGASDSGCVRWRSVLVQCAACVWRSKPRFICAAMALRLTAISTPETQLYRDFRHRLLLHGSSAAMQVIHASRQLLPGSFTAAARSRPSCSTCCTRASPGAPSSCGPSARRWPGPTRTGATLRA